MHEISAVDKASTVENFIILDHLVLLRKRGKILLEPFAFINLK